ncbi:endonuclease VII domain-containing protein [Mesorhizobium sp. M0139]|uniref:endonuclease VII domain-containing protein n=1 Tax=Mesorhizobium sp. M0139 TaxID=2956892 RepID=UPI0033359198
MTRHLLLQSYMSRCISRFMTDNQGPARKQAYDAKWRKENKARTQEYFRDWYKANKERRSASERKRKYGLTAEQWAAVFDAQGGRCAICLRDTPGSKRGWNGDHCHTMGVFRGILCRQCNHGLGNFQDNIDNLRRATAYLERHIFA